MDVVDLRDIEGDMRHLVGGKALGLGRMIRLGVRVPDGFCVTTRIHSLGEIPKDAVLDAYHRLGRGRVAVRSSATAEDLADASFAGQLDTFLNVEGDEELLAAIEKCWASLDSARAVAYREAHSTNQDAVSMAVVVQRMVDPQAAGVMLTANPITGTRSEIVIDAVPGLGTGVVDGSMQADHFVLGRDEPPKPHGCLSTDDLVELRQAGRYLENTFGEPQDVEWAFDADTLWLLQSRPITTLYPAPASANAGDLRVYLEVGHMQGMHGPVTPMGMSALRTASDQWFKAFGVRANTDEVVVDIAGRMFLDLTGFVRNRRFRGRLPEAMQIYGPGVTKAMYRILDDPRLASQPGRLVDLAAVSRVAIKLAPGTIAGTLRALARPAPARRRAFKIRDQAQRLPVPKSSLAADRIALAAHLQDPVMSGPLMSLLPPLWASILAREVAAGLLKGVAVPGEIDATQRGMPYNVTTEMDLKLWSIASNAEQYRDLLLKTPPDVLATRYRLGELPEFGLTAFLAEYGHRGAAEIDVGVPRWAEDPTPLFAALAGYLRVTDSDTAPDLRFARAAAEADESLDLLVGRALRSRPLRAATAGFLLRRSRALAGLRELPKFVWLYPLGEVRRQLLLAGEELTHSGTINRADDIMFLTLSEAAEAAAGKDQRARAATRRAEYARETRRRRVPGLLLSDGTMPEALPDEEALASASEIDRLIGMPAAAGTATGTVRVVYDPATARIEPGDILVAPTTDPGWTPLFLTAGGLITETGSTMAHGPTVAREYGIPAVICVPEATTRLVTGQTVTIDGASGVVQVIDTMRNVR
jgi:phosphohistidine swiveling domain-containing protein